MKRSAVAAALGCLSILAVTCSDPGSAVRDAGEMLVDAGEMIRDVGIRDAGAQPNGSMRFEAQCSTSRDAGNGVTHYFSDISVAGLEPSQVTDVFALGCGHTRSPPDVFAEHDCAPLHVQLRPGSLRVHCGFSQAGFEDRWSSAHVVLSM